MKVGIVFHGHVRSFRKTNISFKKNVLRVLSEAGHEHDIFMHTWDTEEFTTKTWHEGTKQNKDTDLDEIKSIYEPKGLIVEKQELQNVKKLIFDRPYSALKAVWLSAHKAIQMMEEQEEKQNFKYDCVIITRPDVQYFSKIFLDEIEDVSKTWQCQIFTKKAASDVLLYGNRNSVCRCIKGFYLNFDDLNSDKNIKKYRNNEYVFNDYIKTQTTINKSQYCMPRDWRILRSWWDEDHFEGHRKWDPSLAIKDIQQKKEYNFFKRGS